MTNEIKNIEWTMKNGWNAIVTIEHVTTEDINADGHVVAVKCNKIEKTLEIKKAEIVERDFYFTTNVTPAAKSAGAHGTIDTDKGVIGVPGNICAEITAAIDSFTTKKEIVPEPTRGFGWCDKCESYCYGDC